MTSLSLAINIKKMFPTAPVIINCQKLYGWSSNPFPHRWMVSKGLILCRSYADSDCCELMGTTAVPCLEGTSLQHVSSSSYIHSTSSSAVCAEPLCRGGLKMLSFRLNSKQLLTLCLWQIISLCSSNYHFKTRLTDKGWEQQWASDIAINI